MVALPVQTDRAGAWPKVLDNRVRPACDCQLPGEVENHVLGSSPPVHGAGKSDPYVLWIQQLPGQAGHHLHGVGTAHSHRARAEPAGVGCVRVGPDHQRPRESVILQHHLVDNPCARCPKADPELGRGVTQEIVDFAVFLPGLEKVRHSLYARLYQMVAMHRGRHGNSVPARLHEVEHDRLAQHVLQRNPVRSKQEVAFPGYKVGRLRVVKVRKQDLV